MSTHHDYTENASRYDAVRVPAGANHIIGALHVRLRKPLAKLHVLDAGAGTGNYAKELLDAGVGQVDLLDANGAMLNIARAKLRKYVEDGRARIAEHHLPTIPFPNQSFDCVMFLFVLNHLDKHNFHRILNAGEKPSYPYMQYALKEAKRVLQPRGFIVIQTAFNEQIRSTWWMKLMPLATKKIGIQCPDYPFIRKALENSGFEDPETIAMLDTSHICDEVMLDPEGPLKEEIRKSISIWSLATQEEIDHIVKRLTLAKQNRTLVELMTDLDKDTLKFGRYSFMFAST